MHPNTVTYRVNQAESILGRSVDSDAAEVTVALALLPLLPGCPGRADIGFRVGCATGRYRAVPWLRPLARPARMRPRRHCGRVASGCTSRASAGEWSPEAAQIHGHDPAPMTLTTEQVMSYKHPDDRARILANMEHLRRTHEVTSSRYRMIDAHGQNRELIVVGQELLDETGAAIGSTAFYIDVTPEEDKLADALAVVVGTSKHDRTGQALIAYGIDANTAFEILETAPQRECQDPRARRAAGLRLPSPRKAVRPSRRATRIRQDPAGRRTSERRRR